MLTFDDILRAHERIRDLVVRTPVMTSTTVDRLVGCSAFFKCENLQRAGAFKFRGALNCLSALSEEERRRGVITHSSGNHAQALSLAAHILGVKAVIVMPSNSSSVKIEATRGYGGEVVLCEPTLDSRESTARSLTDEHGYVMVHPYNDERIMAGAGTAALELVQEVGKLDYVFVPIGGGGLASGTAVATKSMCPESKVIAAEPKNADDAYRSLKEGKIIPSINPKTIADGLRTSLGNLTFAVIREHVDEIVTVEESEIVEAMRILWERMKMVVEPSGAVALAGLLKMKHELGGKRAGVIVSGGNVDLSSFFEQYDR